MPQRKKYHNIQLTPEDYTALIDAANKIKGPVMFDLSGPSAVRLITKFVKIFNEEQMKKYNEAIDMWRKSEE